MILDQFLEETVHLSMVHIYFEKKQLDILNPIHAHHQKIKYYDMANTKEIPSVDIVFIELFDNSKSSLKPLVEFFTKHNPIISYIFAEEVNNLFLLKFALHFGITDVLPLRNEPSVLNTLFTKTPNKLDRALELSRTIVMSKNFEQSFPMAVFQNNNLTYANRKIQSLLDETHLPTIESILREDNDINTLLTGDIDDQTIIHVETEEDEPSPYLCSIHMLNSTKTQKLFSFMPFKLKSNMCKNGLLLNRSDFIENLKDNLVQNSLSDTSMSLILINIDNFEKLTQSFNALALHEFLKYFVAKIIELKVDQQEIAQWSSSFYVILCDECSFDEACEQTRYIQNALIHFFETNKVIPMILSSALCTKNLSLNDLLHVIDKISTKTLSSKEIQKMMYYEIGSLDFFINDEEQIHYLMRNCIHNTIHIKLLNVYKGLCISTQSYIVKQSDETYHLHCETIQGYAMQLERETILQAHHFPKNIKAEVILVDIKKSFAVIKNLQFIPYSANNRQHTRVQPIVRIPVMLSDRKKISIRGEMIDISIHSLAICFYHKMLKQKLSNETVRIIFSLPHAEMENGFVNIDFEAKVMIIVETSEYSKVIISLEDLKKPYSEYLLHYMYTRQKELVAELKRITKPYN
ncbi:MAG: hypothetical protein KU29_02305 [Sulfurovum sp. FS06-10]|nr:MAG: hypothetical protein KU29_02305 [Sulfurovum sp. FS06-10]